MSDLEQFRRHSSVSAQDAYDLMKESVERLEKQMIANANSILRINDLLTNVRGALKYMPAKEFNLP